MPQERKGVTRETTGTSREGEVWAPGGQAVGETWHGVGAGFVIAARRDLTHGCGPSKLAQRPDAENLGAWQAAHSVLPQALKAGSPHPQELSVLSCRNAMWPRHLGTVPQLHTEPHSETVLFIMDQQK